MAIPTPETQPDIAPPRNVASEAQTPVAIPNTINPEAAGNTPAPPNVLTAETQSPIAAPRTLTTQPQPDVPKVVA